MKLATTLQFRKIANEAITKAGAPVYGTWTDNSGDRGNNLRRVRFDVGHRGDHVVPLVKLAMLDAGYGNDVTTSYGGERFGATCPLA